MKVKSFKRGYLLSKIIFISDERFQGNFIVHFLQNIVLWLCVGG